LHIIEIAISVPDIFCTVTKTTECYFWWSKHAYD